MARTTRGPIVQVVDRAGARLARVAGRRRLLRRWLPLVLLSALIGAARPLCWPLGDSSPLWLGAALALGVMAALAAAGSLLLLLVGRRDRPSPLTTARAIDEALGLRGVVSNGYAFERDGREGALERLARSQAEESARGFDPRSAFALPSLRPRLRGLALAALLATFVAVVGSYHPALASILVAPPTEPEVAAAEALEGLARELERREARAGEEEAGRSAPERLDPESPGAEAQDRRSDRELAQRALKAARAARRGDRAGALRHLDELGREGRAATKESAAMRDALHRIAAALEQRPARSGSDLAKTAEPEGSSGREGREGGEGRQAEGAEESKNTKAAKEGGVAERLEELAKSLRGPEKSGREGTEARRAALEALARAVHQSERAASRAKGAPERRMAEALAEALSKAGRSLSQGKRGEASKRLAEAIRQARQMEGARRSADEQAEAIARMLESAGLLGQQMQVALAGQKAGRSGRMTKSGMAMGKKGAGRGRGRGQGQGEGQGQPGGEQPSSNDLARALALRLAALGLSGGPPSGQPGRGREGSANNFRTPGKALPVKGSLRARSVVSEGERAVTAIRGLGSSSEPTRAYQDVFPSYSALAEESMAEESIPAAQRHVVRRYFESIRPGGGRGEGGGDAESSN